MTRTVLQASVSKTASFNGAGVSIASLTAPAMVQIDVTSLTSAAVVIFEIQTSTDAFATDVRTEKAFTFKGPLASTYPISVMVNSYEMAGLRVGTASATMRIALTYISTGTVVYKSQIVTH